MQLTMKFMILFPERELQLLATHIIQAIDDAAQSIDSARVAYSSALHEAIGGEQQELHEAQGAYEEFQTEVLQLARRLVIVGLQSLCEKTLKRVLIHRGFPTPLKNMGCEQLESALKKMGLDISNLAGYSEFNALRSAANSIKHDSDSHPEITPTQIHRHFRSVTEFLMNVCRQ